MDNYKAMWEREVENNAWITAQNQRLKGNKRENPTLRDQFAMAAMTGLLANNVGRPQFMDYAARAYEIAGYMMMARDGGK